MIVNPQTADKRFDVITRMGLGSLEQAAQIKRLETQLEAERTRANKAESLVHVLEAQLTHPRYEATTLVHEVQGNDLRAKADRELADHRNAGWHIDGVNAFLVDLGKVPQYIRIITLTRVAPIPAEPAQPSATVAVAATKLAPAATPTVKDSLIVAGSVSSEDEFQAELGSAMQSTMQHIRRTNPFFGYQRRSFREIMGTSTQP